MPKKLVIVESPAKAKTIAGYLGPEFVVESSIGHIRDLPKRASDVPKEERKRFGALGVDLEDEFKPYYIVDPDKKKVIAGLKSKLKDADELLLATDEDREGEAIAWHIQEVLQPKVPTRRMVFHEITKGAIEDALGHTREIDQSLVDSQETRRILDRLYGYEVSPVLWKKVMPRLSAGRVQSVATRLVVERERERMEFVSAAYWDIEGVFDPGRFAARLVQLDGKRIAQGRDFGPDAQLVREDVRQLGEDDARSLAAGLEGADFAVRSVEEKPYTRRPAAPFMTSTLQQEASRKLRFTAQTTMRVAQRLYERGYITYMRTDSTTLSETALTAARTQARELYGQEFVPDAPRRYDRKVKNAQEAHEAIRPAGERFRLPADVRGELDRDEQALYELVWMRTVASQMADARGQTVSLRVGAIAGTGEDVEFGVSGTVITFRGFLAAYEEGRDEAPEEDEDRPLPHLKVGDAVQPALARAAGPRDLAAGPLHGADARQGAGGLRHRPPVDVRVDPRDDPRPWVCREARPGARADVPGFRRDEAARAALRQARRLRLHGADGGRSRPHRRRRGAAGRLADDGSTGARTASPACTPWSRSTSTRSMPAR